MRPPDTTRQLSAPSSVGHMLLNHSEAKAGRLHVGDTVVTPVAGFTSFGWGGSRGALGADYARHVRIAITSQGRQLTAPIRDIGSMGSRRCVLDVVAGIDHQEDPQMNDHSPTSENIDAAGARVDANMSRIFGGLSPDAIIQSQQVGEKLVDQRVGHRAGRRFRIRWR